MTEQWFGIGCHLLSACILNFAESPETQQRDTNETGPSIVFYGARLWESQAAMVQARILGTDTLQKLVYRLLMPIGYQMAELRFQKEKPGLLLKTLHLLADRVLFRPLKSSLGLSKARICYSYRGHSQSGGLPILPCPEYSLKEPVLFHRRRPSDRDQE